MNDQKLVETVRQICQDTFWETLDVEVLPVILDYANGVEAIVAKLKKQIFELTKAETKPKHEWNPNTIKWEKSEGFKGEYERSEDFSNPNFKAMLKDLALHDGILTREGYFYWVFQNGSTVGRKKRG